MKGKQALEFICNEVNKAVFRVDEKTYKVRVWKHIEYGGYIMALDTCSIDEIEELLSVFSFPVEKENGETEEVSVFEVWIQQTHPIRRTVYAPGCNIMDPDVENTFYGPCYPKEQCVEGDVTPLLNHIMSYICRGVDKYFKYFVSWFAYVLQNPGKKPTTALVLQSFHSKDLTVAIYKLSQVWGSFVKNEYGNVVVYEDMETMFHRFSAVQPSDFLVMGDHINLKDERYRPQLDQAISTIDSKTNNAAYVFLETNVHAINLPRDDQRFFCLDCDSKRISSEQRKEIKDINPIHVAHFLYHWDWKAHGFDPHAAPPLTLFKKLQMLMTQDAVARTLVPFVYEGKLVHVEDESDRYVFTLRDTQDMKHDDNPYSDDDLTLNSILYTLFYRPDPRSYVHMHHPDWVPFSVLRDHVKEHGGEDLSVQKISATIKKMLRVKTDRAFLEWQRKQARVIKMPTQAQAKQYLEEYVNKYLG